MFEDKNFIEMIRGSSAAFIFRISGMFLSYLFMLLITKIYGADILGIFALCVTLLQVFTVVGKMGVDTALMRFISEFSSKNEFGFISRISKLAVALIVPGSFLLSVIVFVFSGEIAASVFRKPYLTEYFRITAVGILPNILIMLNSERLRGLKRISEYSFLRNASVPLLTCLLLGGVSLFFRNRLLPVSLYQLAVILTSAASIFLWKKSFASLQNSSPAEAPGNHQSPPGYRKLLGLAIPMLFTNSLILLMGWTDTVMLGIFRSTADVGIYRVPLRLAALISITLVAVNSILGPKVTELWEKKQMKELRKMVRQSTSVIFLTSLPVFVFLWLFRHPVLALFGSDFLAGSTAFLMLISGQLLNSVVGSVGLILIVTGRQLVIQNVMILGTIINIALNYLLIPRYGINGAAFASMVSMVFINIVPFFLVKKHLGFYTLPANPLRPLRR